MKTVMVVDDSRFMIEEICNLLEGSNYTVTARCRDAEEAIVAYSAQPPDIVLMDIVLPGIDGLEATTALLGKWKEARVIVISSLAYGDTAQKAAACGAKATLFKPFTKEQLLQALEANC